MRHAHIPAAFLALALVMAAEPAPAEELPQTAACRQALKALGDAEDGFAAHWAAESASCASCPRPTDAQRQRQMGVRLLPLRQQVADACLGGVTTSPSPSRSTWPALAPTRPSNAGPMAPGVPRAPLTTAAPGTVIPPVRVEGPLSIGHCNAATCVTSDGSTLTRVGPNLVGPRGLCTVQGAFVHCP